MKTKLILCIVVFLAFTSVKAQHKNPGKNNAVKKTVQIDKLAMANQVRLEFLHAWLGYKKFAWGYDALKPLSKTGHNWYAHSLLMTPVDALDGLLIMGLEKEAADAEKIILDSLRFNYDMDVQNFEISIRILGGLISAYELNNNPRFLELATDLGNRLIKAFNSPTGMPYRYVNLNTGKTKGNISNPAEIGTYIVEYGILSKHTGNPVYFETAKKAMLALNKYRSKINLIGTSINVETGEWTNTESHVSGCIDSYLEYLLKSSVLFNDKEMKQIWNENLTAVNTYIADEEHNGLWYGHSDMNTGKRLSTSYGSLDAFFAACLAMGGDLPRAEKLQASNYKMFMQNGIEPEEYDYAKMEAINPQYILRPENLESAYYLYNFTKNEKYLKQGQDMFLNIVKYCRTTEAYAALKDVKTKEKKDYMESFFLAETLKYAFLLFDDNHSIDFNKVIFNTEAHLYKR
ncbi:MAG: glycoside hydrolase family 47 protein [Bacteroidetes bacterium]|nr:glycoside hydrolase family 47 protein [Bacteroidota bacterium]